mgnify:CR=1 FL=1
MTLELALRLGRVSNLPTVWTNVAAAIVLAGGVPHAHTLGLLALAASLFYVGGMFLNDVYDAEIDQRERPERPIPSGAVDRAVVERWGYGLLASGIVVIGVHGLAFGTMPVWRALLAGVATCTVIVVYDRWHKGNPAAPVIMGLCRVGVYVTAALAVAPGLSPSLLAGAALLLGYVLGLTYVARFENEVGKVRRWWPLVGLLAPMLYMVPVLRGAFILRAIVGGFGMWVFRSIDLLRRGVTRDAVVSLIAGISLLDALLLIRHGQLLLALGAVGAFGLTLALQRKVAGT